MKNATSRSNVTNRAGEGRFALGSSAPGVRGLLAAWLFLGLAQVVASFSDASQATQGPTVTVLRVVLSNLPLVVYCLWQYHWFMRHPVALTSIREAVRLFAMANAGFFVPFVLFQAAINPILLGDKPWSSWPEYVSGYPALLWTFDFMIFAGSFFVALAASAWQAREVAARHHHFAETENLKLRLALERQRSDALRAQLEPHFLFNALNAVSALVRAGDRRGAITGIATLSSLLRRAVEASRETWSTVGVEIDFLRDYLGLQELRFGRRLALTLPDLEPHLASWPIPPMLLQPLIENVIRHDLERHDKASDLLLKFFETGNALCIVVSNPLRDDCPNNPGTGLGIACTQERLALAYGDRASLAFSTTAGRFEVTVYLPDDDNE